MAIWASRVTQRTVAPSIVPVPESVPRQWPGVEMELCDDTLRVYVDHVNVNLAAIGVGIDECRVEGPRVNLDRLVLAPFVLPTEAVPMDDSGVARKVPEQDEQIKVLVLAGRAPEESVHAPAPHHPAPDTVPVEKFVDRLCLHSGHRRSHGRICMTAPARGERNIRTFR